MTRQLEHVSAGTPCGLWFRQRLKDSNDGLCIIDIDQIIYLIWDWQLNRLMLLEEKARADTIHSGQGRALGLLTKMLAHGAKPCNIDYWGLHVLRMENTRPDNSKWLTLDGNKIAEDRLIRVLNFEEKP